MTNHANEVQLIRAELAATRNQLGALINGSLDAVITIDHTGTILRWNPQAVSIFGWSESDAVGRLLTELIIPAELREAHAAGLARILSTRKPTILNQRIELDAITRDSTRLAVELTVLAHENTDSFEFTAIVRDVSQQKTFLDITERKQLESAQQQIHDELEGLVSQRTADLAATRARLELALRGGNVGLWDWNAETDKVFFSDTYKHQLGFASDAPWDNFSDWESHLHPDDHDAALARVHAYFANPLSEYDSMFRLRGKDGSYRWILARGKAQFDENGKPLRMVGVHIDITQRKRNERELVRLNDALANANDALQQSNVELQQFAYVASHDLQTPLRAIAGFAQFLQSDYEPVLDERANNFIDRIVNGAKRMQRMIDDLLAFSRVESRAATFLEVAMDDVVSDALELLAASVSDRNAQVTCDSLPVVMGDQPQLVQLMQNLIGNGLKYCETTPVIHVSAADQNDSWVFSVKDNGIGIPANQFEKIFEVFQRLHPREAYPGTGIGLAVCKRIVGRHGGNIWVESTPTGGSTFYFSLPISAR